MVCEAQAQPLPLTLVRCCGTYPSCCGITSLYFVLNLDRGPPETFTFLGFTHYCSHSRNGKFRVKRKTSKKKFNKKIKEMDYEIRDRLIVIGLPAPEVIKWLNQVLVGYFHYYGITDNSYRLNCFVDQMKKLLFKWLNRRSQKRSFSWDTFNDLLKDFPLAKPRIYVSIFGN